MDLEKKNVNNINSAFKADFLCGLFQKNTII